jgi:hypothetical protein
MPVEPVAGETEVGPKRETGRRRSRNQDHDPSIIPGLADDEGHDGHGRDARDGHDPRDGHDDGHDDEIGRDGR